MKKEKSKLVITQNINSKYYIIKFFEIYKNIKDRIQQHYIREYTAQCAYYAILSFVPFLILTVTLVQYTNISKESLISIIQIAVPSTMVDIAMELLEEIYSKSIGTISLSAIFVLWSANKGIFALIKGLENIYETNKKNNYIYIKVKSLICTIIFIMLIIFVLVFSVFGNLILEEILIKFSISKQIINIFNISKIFIYFVLFLVFLLMYTIIPLQNTKIKNNIPGAILATLGWYISSFFFSVYINMFKGFSIMYGSLTTITLSIMWIYFCMYIILIGGEINTIYYEKKSKNIK